MQHRCKQAQQRWRSRESYSAFRFLFLKAAGVDVNIMKEKCTHLRPVDWMAEFQRNASPVDYHVSTRHTREGLKLARIINVFSV